jgi:hypothetical protein
MRGEHRVDADLREALGGLLAARAALARVGEEPAQRRGQRRRALAAVVARAAHVVPVFRDVGEQREIAEGPHHRDGLLVAQRVERSRERPARLHVFEAPARDREAANRLDALEGGLALVGADGVAEEPPEEPDVLAQARVLVVAIVHGRKRNPVNSIA